MRTRASLIVLICFFWLVTAGVASAQHLDVKEIEPLIEEWNFANNERSIESFENVYADRLLFYTQQVTKQKAISLKQNLFNTQPEFKQRIVKIESYEPYTSGVIKCDFVKEVSHGEAWKAFPSYLLISYEHNRYWIVGESDYDTDQKLNYTLSLGEPIILADDSMNISVVSNDTTSVLSDLKNVADSSIEYLNSGNLASVFAPLASMELVSIPKRYIFILIGILIVGGIMMFIADSIQERRRPGRKSRGKEDDAEHMIQDFKMQSAFEAFVITLFDPLYFRYRRPKTEKVMAGRIQPQDEIQPDLEFEFNHKDIRTKFAVQCLYRENQGRGDVRLFSAERLQIYRHFEEVTEIPLYYVIGVGGSPDDPQELYLVPAKAVRTEVVSKTVLYPFRKSGMFFFNSNADRLQ